MTTYATIFLSSIFIAYLGHHWGERILARRGQKQFRIVLRGYQIHHSFYGALAILAAVSFASGVLATALFGYGLGNLWQHKKTHNRLNEKGMVFITRYR